MRDMFVNKGVAVFVVNSNGVELTLPPSSHPPSPFIQELVQKTKELHQHIIELYTDYDVSRWPCVITGNICVGRGISIQQPNFMFNFGILSNCAKKTEASQNAGRLKGNFKHWEGYAPPRVYTTEMFDKIAKEYETQSREIARIAFEKLGGQEGTAIVTNTEVKNVICSEYWTLIEGEFDTLDEANKLLHKNGCRGKTYKSLKTNEDGFILSSTTKKLSVLQYELVKLEMKSWITTSTFDIKTGKKSYGRLYIAYTDLDDNKSVKFLVRIAIEKHE